MADMMRLAANADSAISREIIVDAYRSVRFRRADYQDELIGNFRDKWTLNCYEGLAE